MLVNIPYMEHMGYIISIWLWQSPIVIKPCNRPHIINLFFGVSPTQPLVWAMMNLAAWPRTGSRSPWSSWCFCPWSCWPHSRDCAVMLGLWKLQYITVKELPELSIFTPIVSQSEYWMVTHNIHNITTNVSLMILLRCVLPHTQLVSAYHGPCLNRTDASVFLVVNMVRFGRALPASSG